MKRSSDGFLLLTLFLPFGLFAQVPDSSKIEQVPDTIRIEYSGNKYDIFKVLADSLKQNLNLLAEDSLKQQKRISVLDTLRPPARILDSNSTISLEVFISGAIYDTANPYRRIQLVSKKAYDFFPVDVLNRFNTHAPFFFDGRDKRVKSVIFKSEEDMPQVYFLRRDIDTVFFYLDEILSEQAIKERRNIEFTINRNRIEGDLADYLVRLSFRKEFVLKEENIQVTITDVESASLQNIIDKLYEFRIRGQLKSPVDQLK